MNVTIFPGLYELLNFLGYMDDDFCAVIYSEKLIEKIPIYDNDGNFTDWENAISRDNIIDFLCRLGYKEAEIFGGCIMIYE